MKTKLLFIALLLGLLTGCVVEENGRYGFYPLGYHHNHYHHYNHHRPYHHWH